MAAMSERDLRRRDGLSLDPEDDVGDLSAIARRLGGEVDGRFIRMPSPGCDADDRSCFILINPARPRDFYVYGCEGSWDVARAAVREKLGQVEGPSVDHSLVALKIWNESE